MDTVKGGECNSSWQTLIFLLSFPPAPGFVDLAPISDAILVWMDFWLRCKGIVSLRVQSAGEQVTEWHNILSGFPVDCGECPAQGLEIHSLSARAKYFTITQHTKLSLSVKKKNNVYKIYNSDCDFYHKTLDS